MRKMFLSIVFGFLAIGFLMSGCNSGERIVPPSTGKSSELLIIADKITWNGESGKEVREFFTRDIEGLPQPEPMYSIVNISESDFSSIFQSHRNLLIISIKEEFQKPFIETKRDLWSKPQRVIKINASSDSAVLRLLNEHKHAFQKMYDQMERERIQQAYRSVADVSIRRQLHENFGLSVVVPQGYYVAEKTSDFMWLRRETLEFSQGILIYTYPYADTVSFNKGYIAAMRDVITELHVPGTFDRSFMTVSRSVIPLVSQRVDLNGLFAVETRGLWEVKNDYMGGPFVNYTFIDEENGNVVTIDGYVYAPKDNKRDLIRQMEAICHTINLKTE